MYLLLACADPTAATDDTKAALDSGATDTEPVDTEPAETGTADSDTGMTDTDSGTDTGSGTGSGVDLAACDGEGKVLSVVSSPLAGGAAGDEGALMTLDVDADGVRDLLVGAPDAATARAWLVSGVDLESGDLEALASARLDSGPVGALAGFAAHDPGDEDGDGPPDVVIGASEQWLDNAGGGAVYLFAGGPGLGTATDVDDARFVIDQPDGVMVHLGVLADVDGDGLADLLAAGPFDHDGDNEASFAGTVALFGGGSLSGHASLDDADHQVQGDYSSDHFGSSLASGDIDGDGYGDVLAGSPGREFTGGNGGIVYLLAGGARLEWGERAIQASRVQFAGNNDDEEPGRDPLAQPADLDGDGTMDVTLSDSRIGKAWTWAGGAELSGLVTTIRADATYQGDGASFGSALATGDVDGDGVSDLLIGDPAWDGDGGAVWAFVAPLGGGDPLTTADAATAWLGAAGSRLGTSAGGLGDLDGDGHDELAAGAPGLDADAGGVCILTDG